MNWRTAAPRSMLGLAGGAVGLCGLSLANGLLPFSVLGARALAGLVAGAMAWLAARPSRLLEAPEGRTVRDGPALVAVLLTAALAVAAFGSPNPPKVEEFMIDRRLGGQLQLLIDAGASPWLWLGSLLGVLAGSLAAALLERWRSTLIAALLALALASFLVAAPRVNPVVQQEAANPPQPYQYFMDGFVYLRTFWVMRDGHGYYRAFAIANAQRRVETTLKNAINWRLPTVFYTWWLLAGNGEALITVFRILCCLAAISGFLLCQRFVDGAVALWAGILLAGWYLYGAATIWFAFPEYWTSFFLLPGLAAWLRGRWIIGGTLLALAALAREQQIVLLPLMALLAFLERERPARLAASCTAGAIVLGYALHYAVVSGLIEQGGSGNTAVLLSQGGLGFLWHCLDFGSVYLANREFMLPALLLAGALGALAIPGRERRTLLGGMAWLPALLLVFVGSEGRWYWGVLLVPQILAAAPLLVSVCPSWRALVAEESPPPPRATPSDEAMDGPGRNGAASTGMQQA